MRLADLMQSDVKTIAESQSAADAAEMMRRNGFHHLVVTVRGKVVGVVSDGDVRNLKGDRRDLGVGDVMHRDAITATPHTTVREAANLMRGRAIGCLPVIKGDALVGIVTTSDLLELIGRGGIDRPHEPPQVRRTQRQPRPNF